MPKRDASSPSPMALVKSPLPSASIRTSSPTPWSSPQAFITKTSFTATQAMVSTPLAFSAAAFCVNPGRCLAEQVGVNAPGTANRATFLPVKSSSVLIGRGPSGPKVVKVALGTLSPTFRAMVVSSLGRKGHRAGRAPRQGPKPRGLETAPFPSENRGMSESDAYLAGRMLVAMPGIGDPRFERAVVFLCAHNAEHAMGLA